MSVPYLRANEGIEQLINRMCYHVKIKQNPLRSAHVGSQTPGKVITFK